MASPHPACVNPEVFFFTFFHSGKDIYVTRKYVDCNQGDAKGYHPFPLFLYPTRHPFRAFRRRGQVAAWNLG